VWCGANATEISPQSVQYSVSSSLFFILTNVCCSHNSHSDKFQTPVAGNSVENASVDQHGIGATLFCSKRFPRSFRRSEMVFTLAHRVSKGWYRICCSHNSYAVAFSMSGHRSSVPRLDDIANMASLPRWQSRRSVPRSSGNRRCCSNRFVGSRKDGVLVSSQLCGSHHSRAIVFSKSGHRKLRGSILSFSPTWRRCHVGRR
jgi:hypothetical protein